MIRRISLLLLAGVLGVGAELWVNAIRDPGAELGQGDWGTDVRETKEGASDSAQVSAHDTSRSYEGAYSFLTDTEKNPQVGDALCEVWCFQNLQVPKAVKDTDSCFWMVYVNKDDVSQMMDFWIYFRSEERMVYYSCGQGESAVNDSVYILKLPLPNRNEWTEYAANLYDTWTNLAFWSPQDTIVQIQLRSSGWTYPTWRGQEVSWDNIVLRSIAYYDYAAESIDSDELTDQTYTPIATFSNKGKLDEFSVYVYAEIYRQGSQEVVYKDSVEVSISSDGTQQVTFADYQHVPDASVYWLRVFPLLENDEYSADDTLELQLTAAVEEKPEFTESVTIHHTQSGVLFSFTPGLEGKLSIYDASGRQVYVKPVKPGTSELTWSTRKVPSGLYFYKLSSPDKVFSGKLVVIH